MREQIVSKQASIRKRVYEFYLKNRDRGKMFTKDHFVAEGIAKRTIYRIIQVLRTNLGTKEYLKVVEKLK